MTERGDFIPKNFPPSKNREPVCPHYQLIEICAAFVGISPGELQEEFCCGELVEPFDEIGLLSGSAGTRFTAQATCRKIHEELEELIKTANEVIELPSVEEVENEVKSTPGLKEKGRILAQYNAGKQRQEERDNLIARWKEVAFNLTVVPASETEENGHFRKIEKPKDLSDEEVVKKANSFFNSLDEIVVGKEESPFFLWSDGAENCPQSPSSLTLAHTYS